MNRYALLALLVISGLFALGRFTLVSGHRPLSVGGSYEALAHIFIGWVLGCWWISKDREYLWLALALSAVELTAFLTLGRG